MFSSVQSLSHVQLFATPWTAALQAFPIHHQLPEFTQTHVHGVGVNRHILWCEIQIGLFTNLVCLAIKQRRQD